MHKLGFVMQKLGSSCKSQVLHSCLTIFQPRQCFIDPLVVIHPNLSCNTSFFSMCSVQIVLVQRMFYYVPATLVVYGPFGDYPFLFKSQYMVIFNAFCATFAGPYTVGCYACLFVSIASLMSSI